MSRFSFDTHAADAYRQFYRSVAANGTRPTTAAPQRPTESSTGPSDRAIPQADGEP